ncbi:MAG: hypothetical protein ACNA7Q_08620, partial [Rhodobacterales bacterium]
GDYDKTTVKTRKRQRLIHSAAVGERVSKDLCMTPFRPQDEGSACLGWRSGGPGPNAPTSHETQPLQRVGPSEAPAGGQETLTAIHLACL